MRRKLYAISYEGFEGVFGGMADRDQTLHVDNWPEDAKVLGAHIDPARQQVLLTVESESFPDLPSGAVLYTDALQVSVSRPQVYVSPPIPAQA